MPSPRAIDAPWIPWSGIESDHITCAMCSWSHKDGAMTVKFVNRACPQHGHVLSAADKNRIQGYASSQR